MMFLIASQLVEQGVREVGRKNARDERWQGQFAGPKGSGEGLQRGFKSIPQGVGKGLTRVINSCLSSLL